MLCSSSHMARGRVVQAAPATGAKKSSWKKRSNSEPMRLAGAACASGVLLRTTGSIGNLLPKFTGNRERKSAMRGADPGARRDQPGRPIFTKSKERADPEVMT